MRLLKLTLFTFTAVILAVILSLFLFRNSIASYLTGSVLNHIAKTTQRNINFSNTSYFPPNKIVINELAVGKAELSAQTEFTVKRISLNINLIKFLFSKKITADIAINGLEKDDFAINSVLKVNTKSCEKISDLFKENSCESVKIIHMDIANPYVNIKNIEGTFFFAPNSIISENMKFNIHDTVYSTQLKITDLKTNPDIQTIIKSDGLSSTINLKKIKDSIHIDNVDVNFYGSVINSKGTLSLSAPKILSLESSGKINVEDILKIYPDTQDTLGLFKGYFKHYLTLSGPIDNIKTAKATVDVSSPNMSLRGFSLKDFSLKANVQNGLLRVPEIKAYPYKGALNAEFEINTAEQLMPLYFKGTLENIQIYDLSRDTDLKNINIHGDLSGGLALSGFGKIRSSLKGNGYINIENGNLGPMPVLSPLVGKLYGVISGVLPALKRVEIKGGSCTFNIHEEKVITDDLLLYGDAVNIKARGYIDFDKNLDFEVENEFIDSEETDVQRADGAEIVELIAGFGKMIGKARLKGTLEKPRWEFEYFTNFKNILTRELQNVIRGFFQ